MNIFIFYSQLYFFSEIKDNKNTGKYILSNNFFYYFKFFRNRNFNKKISEILIRKLVNLFNFDLLFLFLSK